MTQRNMSYYRGQLRRSVDRFRDGKIDGEVLAREVERFLRWAEPK